MEKEIIDFIKENNPCYVYDQKKVIEQCQKLKATLQDVDILYSVKANPFEPIIKTIKAQGMIIDAASLNEVELALKVGYNQKDIYYSAPGKSLSDLKKSINKCQIIVDSLNELEKLNQIAQEFNILLKVGIRINPNYNMDSQESISSKFGIDYQQLNELKTVLNKAKYLEVNGLHIHVKSQVLDYAKIGKYYFNTFDLAQKISQELNLKLEYLNLGSGIGISYDNLVDVDSNLLIIKKAITQLQALNKRTLNVKLLIESGRFLVAQAGSYYTQIIDIKTSLDQKYYIVVNGLNGFMRTSIANFVAKISDHSITSSLEPLYTNDNAFAIEVLNDNTKQESVNIVGNLCTGLDVIKENVLVKQAQIDDLIKISNAGSYGYSLSPLLFSSMDRVKQYLLVDNKLLEEDY